MKIKRLMITIMTICMLSVSSVSFAQQEGGIDPELDLIADVIFVRPLGVLSVGVGALFFAASLPFALMTGSTGKSAKHYIANPVLFTFHRPLGEFNYEVGDYN
jgi:hypothetical protein